MSVHVQHLLWYSKVGTVTSTWLRLTLELYTEKGKNAKAHQIQHIIHFTRKIKKTKSFNPTHTPGLDCSLPHMIQYNTTCPVGNAEGQLWNLDINEGLVA